MINPLSRSFFEKDPVTVARALLGTHLVRVLTDGTRLIGSICEVEAYLGETDPAAHSFHGKTKRTMVLYEKAGLAYVHSIHRQICLDVTCETVGKAGSVLIRGIIPIVGVEIMKKNRERNGKIPMSIANGPGKLSQALGIDMSFYGMDLTAASSPLFITQGYISSFSIHESPRIGISKAKEDLLRFFIKD